MKKVVAFIGSPRKNGNTATLVREVIQGAQEAGAETTVFNLYDMNIKPCQGCLVCRKTGQCVMQDDFQNMFKHIVDADVVVFGSPIYLWQVTAQTKLLWDRLCGLFDENHKPRYAAKNLIMVYSQGNPTAQAFQTSFQTTEAMFKMFGLNVVNTILQTGGNAPNAAANNKELLAKAYEAGKAI
ncbi:flavodoxin family protein [Desulfosporosinus sp. PR]|uniref:flavodoxin family protein n=1 Tax=Candidatus Desulfosporosinus nitrosoreducens TaxID=3401928 RepID=UPI0027E99A32|nr:flavodoxin family protein [Desulfosporosinus sp. PR]MDQ7093537.1 flavodoxin family protein [Desulfosporosinus sp. PR]